jgi:Cft2 family RNA processing exonuclease
MAGGAGASLQFLGAAGGVTGSKYLFSYGEDQVLIDCGLFQGLKELRQRNWAPVPIDFARLRAVILTHAHIDHSGYLPRLVAKGYKGPVFATPATCDLLTVMLPDAAYLQEEEVAALSSGRRRAISDTSSPDACRRIAGSSRGRVSRVRSRRPHPRLRVRATLL